MKIFLFVVLILYILCVLGAIVNVICVYIPELKEWRKENTDVESKDYLLMFILVLPICVLCPIINFSLTVMLATESVENLRRDYNKMFTRARLSHLEKKRKNKKQD